MAPLTILNPHTPTPTPTPPQHTPHTPDPVVGMQPTTGTHLPFHPLSFTTYFFYLLSSIFSLNLCIASNKPLPTPVLLSHLYAGTQRTFQPRPRGWMLVFLNLSCLAFILAYVLHNFTFTFSYSSCLPSRRRRSLVFKFFKFFCRLASCRISAFGS